MSNSASGGNGNGGRTLVGGGGDALHTYVNVSVRDSLERTVPQDIEQKGWVINENGEQFYTTLTRNEYIEQKLAVVNGNISPEVLSILQAEGVSIALDHASNRGARLREGAAGHYNSRTKEIVLKENHFSPSVVRHEVGHALSESLQSRIQHFAFESRGSSLHRDKTFQEAVRKDISNINKGSDQNAKTYYKNAEYYAAPTGGGSATIHARSTRNQSAEMFAETFARITSPSSPDTTWKKYFPNTVAAVEMILKSVTSTTLKDGKARKFGDNESIPF